jgi:mono/diheme cytochrome c family protein
MPNMYEPVSYEAYQESDAFANGVEAQLPAEGTIPRGDFMPYDYKDTNEGYEMAKANLTSSLDSTQIDYDRGKNLYDVYCGICHGNKGAGQGTCKTRENIRCA